MSEERRYGVEDFIERLVSVELRLKSLCEAVGSVRTELTSHKVDEEHTLRQIKIGIDEIRLQRAEEHGYSKGALKVAAIIGPLLLLSLGFLIQKAWDFFSSLRIGGH